MKKISKYFIFSLAILIGLIFKADIVNASSVTAVDSGWKFERQQFVGDGKHHASDKFNFYYVDNEVSYCIEPLVHYGSGLVEGTWEDTGLSNDIKERLLLIAYYGYTYPNHNTLEYRAVTQAMIWETIMGENSYVKFSKDYWSRGQMLDTSKERAEIESLIAHHYDRPSFNGSVHKVQKGKSVVLTDTNNVLSQFDVNVNGAEYSVDGNVLTITPNQSGTINVSLSKRMSYTSRYKLFVGDTIQNMIVPGTSDPVVAGVRINVFSGSVEGYKKDKETKTSIPQGQAKLSKAKYGVYEKATGILITTFVTDENGYFKSDSVLESKEYYIQEISNSEGYKLDPTRYEFSMVDKETAYVEVYEEVIKNYVSILKQYDFVDGNTTFLNAEADIEFQILYPNGDIFDTIKTDKNGYATINLPFGRWKFHQVNTNTGFEKIYDFYVTVDEESEKEQYYNILNNQLSAYLQVFKTDLDTGKTIALADTTFKILNTDTNQYVSQFVGGKVISEFKTDSDGKMVTPLKLNAGNYKLIETASPKNYLLNTDGLPFVIGDGTDYNYTNYGAFVTLYFHDQEILGQIEVNKTGEYVVIENGNFTYEKKPLGKVTYEVYANEDILSADGNTLYYEKGQIVDRFTTNKDGYAISKKLHLGSYYIIEVETDDSHVLDTKKYEFTLTQKDNMTPIVYHSYSALNLLKKGTLDFTKTDLTSGKEIPNTKVEIYHIKDDETSELIFTGLTDNDGKIVITNLFVGKFKIIETDPATGYRLSDEVITFEIKENGEVVKANMTNEKITSIIKIHKVDVDGNTLAGVEIGIFDLDNNLLGSYITDENGDIEVELNYGSYFYQELKTIDGYSLNDEKVYFNVTEDGAVIETTLVNVKVPNTSLSDSKVLNVIGIVLAIAGVGYLIYEKKKK